MRQLAWLYAVPQLPPAALKALEQAGQKVEPNKVSRFDAMGGGKVNIPMPPNPMPHFVLWFTELGMVEATGMGSAPLSWREIEAWQHSVRIRFTPWQARMMRTLSLAYLAQKAKSELTTDPAPWSARVVATDRSADEAAIDAAFD